MPRRKPGIRQAQIVEVFAARVRSLRQARGMSQRELAEKAHVTVTYISKLESGKTSPGIDLVERIASSLGVHVTELLPSIGEAGEDHRRQASVQFDLLIGKAGRESLLLLNLFFARLLESPLLHR